MDARGQAGADETTAAGREPVRFLVFAGAPRHESLNARLARVAADAIEANGGEVDRRTMEEFDVPSYDGDVEAGAGFPAGAERLRERLLASDAFVIASPEYNASMPGVLKNALDWVGVKTRWVEFLGEHPDPEVDRVE